MKGLRYKVRLSHNQIKYGMIRLLATVVRVVKGYDWKIRKSWKFQKEHEINSDFI